MDYLKDIEQTLNKIPHIYRVQFSLYCAQSCFDNLTDEQKPLIKQTLGAVSNWLNGVPTSRADLESAAESANSVPWSAARSAAWNAAWNAAYAARNAAYAARNAAYAARSAASAAWSAESAARSAESAAESAAWGVARSAVYKKQLKEFHGYLHNNIVAKITQLEKQLYGLEL